MKREKKAVTINLYYKFTLAMILLGFFPMFILATFMSNNMLDEYRGALVANYEQAAFHFSSSVENMLSVYDSIAKYIYQYDVGAWDGGADYADHYDSLRRVLAGEIYDGQDGDALREREIRLFLQNLESMDGYVYAAHFVTESEEIGSQRFHFSYRNTFFKDEEIFLERIGYEDWDRESRKLILLPVHGTDYYNGMNNDVFTVARNYYDLRSGVGKEKYVGTLFLDIDIQKLKVMFRNTRIDGAKTISLADRDGNCFFSTREDYMGKNLEEGLLPSSSDRLMIISSRKNEYGLKAVIEVDTKEAFERLNGIRLTMYGILGSCAAALLLASSFFSRKLTRPIRRMMEQMGKVESGNFDIEMPVESHDEIGILSERFNHMSRELKKYIDQVYVAEIKKNEAELTALKSQIYPHFLYNTLEVIRMTALENGDGQVSRMIEALSEQIHYLIGPMQDVVPLQKEIDIVKKYIYLLNCRISGKVNLSVSISGSENVLIPKLILQPLVENAYIHGIKPKNGKGSIMIETRIKEESLELSVIDNGVGMDEAEKRQLKKLFAGEEPGIKNAYNWQSIGLKNVNDRIRYLYGERFGIHVTSTAGVGTMIQVILPCRREEE